jgi:threonine dehydratase
MSGADITREAIAATYERIKPHVRRTPVLETGGADLGLSYPLTLKLEFTQCSGSFKARGAFANLLTRKVPAAGVAAASGGNHGAAVAYAAMRLGHKARIFVPEISSPAKIARIQGYGADLVVGGKVYAEALAACEAWVSETGALSVHAFDQRTDRGHRGLVCEPDQDRRRRASLGADDEHGPGSRPAGGRPRGRDRGRFACAQAHRLNGISHRCQACRSRRAG